MKHILFIYLLVIFQFTYAQEKSFEQLKTWQLKGYAKSAVRAGDIYTTIDFKEELLKRKPNNTKLAYELANLYYKVNYLEKAKPLFHKIYRQKSSKFPEAQYYYAQILKKQELYNQAIDEFLLYREKLDKKSKRNIYRYLVNIDIKGCEMALDEKREKEIEISHLDTSINKPHMESAPVIYNDSSFIYASVCVDSIPVQKLNEEYHKPLSKFYLAKNAGQNWTGGYDAPKPFYHFKDKLSSNGVFSKDGLRFYFTSGKRNWKNQMISAIYVSHKKNGKWSKPKKLDERINLRKYTSTQPAIGTCFNKNYEVIYFVSDRPNGWGGMDIWYTVYDKSTKKYKKPINAGGFINTPADEITPFYDLSANTLYFSTNGLPGYGGFDIFKSNGCLVNWSLSENVGRPINSSFDDIYFSSFPKKEEGFLVSNRSESIEFRNPNCCFDIFYHKQVNRPQKTTDDKILIAVDTKANAGSNSYIEKIKKTIDKTVLTFKKNKKELMVQQIDIKDIRNTHTIDSESIVFNNIYFEFNKTALTNESKKLIDSTILVILNEYPNLIVEIGAHTDYIGSEKYNLNLSQKRAESVVNYLVQNGINKNSLIPVGYGEQYPLVQALAKNGKDNPQAREKNRRIEFKILDIIGQN